MLPAVVAQLASVTDVGAIAAVVAVPLAALAATALTLYDDVMICDDDAIEITLDSNVLRKIIGVCNS